MTDSTLQQQSELEKQRAKRRKNRYGKGAVASEARRRKKPEQIAKNKAYRKSSNRDKLDYLYKFNNRFKRMKKKDPSMMDMDDIALKYLVAELKDPETSKERKDQIAFKILPFTSRAKPTAVEHTGEIEVVTSENKQKLEQILFDHPSVVATIPYQEDSDKPNEEDGDV